MRAKCFSMLGVRVGTHGLAPCGAAQTSIEMALRLLQREERQSWGSRVPCLRLFSCLKRRNVVAREEARLELSDPVETFQVGARGLMRDALFEGALRESTIVEGAELRGSSAQGPGERDWRGKSVEEESVPLHELECVLGFALELFEWMALGKKNGAETAGGERAICRVAVLLGHLEGTTRRFDALQQWPCPRNHHREGDIGPCPEVGQSATFQQIAGQLAKSIAFNILAEAGAGDHGRGHIVQQ